MTIKNLKNYNYVRFLQLLVLNTKKKKSLEIIFLLEYELVKIFNATEDNNLRLIKYQWYIDEIKKTSSELSIVNEIIILKKHYDLGNLFEKLFMQYQSLSLQNNNYEEIFLIFRKISSSYNLIIKSIVSESHHLFQTSPIYQFYYFLYHLRIQSLSYKTIKKIMVEYDINRINYFEKMFCMCFLKREQKNLKKKISKMEYIFQIFLGIFIK